MRYSAFGEVRYSSGTTASDYRYTGQLEQAQIGLDYYIARWYDPYLNQWIQPDTIIPGDRERNNLIAVRYVGDTYYSALIVDYNDNQFLEQLNDENRTRLHETSVLLPSIPTNPMAFDRYVYTFNSSVRYNDTDGHCPACAIGVGTLGGLGVTVSASVIIIGALVVVAVVAYDVFAPGREERHAEINAGITSLTNQAAKIANGIQALFARPRNHDAQNKLFSGAVRQLERELGRKLSEQEKRELHEAIHDLEDPGCWDIVDQGHKEFDKANDDGENGD